jgi:hypothetical protein
MKICKIHIITFAYKSARIEFARGKFGCGTLWRAISRHWHEFLETRKRYVDQGGITSLHITFLFFSTVLHSQYIMLRLLIHFYNISRRQAGRLV